jgi:hypothetical protein
MAELESESNRRSIDNAESVHSMELKVSKLQAEAEFLTNTNEEMLVNIRVKDEASIEYRSSIEKLNDNIDNLRRERDFANISLLSCERKLETEKVQMVQLLQQITSMEKHETLLRGERDSLRLSVEVTVSERDALVRDLDQERKSHSFELDMLRSQQTLNESNMVNYEEQMSKLEAVLHDRTILLSQIETKSKDLQMQVERKDVEYRAMEEQSSVLQVRLLDREDELKQSLAEWKHKEDEYLSEIHNERSLREILESDIAILSARLESTKVESRNLMELEKENMALKDKIRRQEAYLQRKIDQEKVVRERIAPGGHLKSPTIAMKTPVRTTREVVLKQASISSSTTPSTVTENESTYVDVDLDSLLAD